MRVWRVLSGLAITGLPVSIYFVPFVSMEERHISSAAMPGDVRLLGLWGLPAAGHPFSISKSTVYSSRRRCVFDWLCLLYIGHVPVSIARIMNFNAQVRECH